MKNTLHLEVLRLHSEIVSRLVFQQEGTGAEPVATTMKSYWTRFTQPTSVKVITTVFESVNPSSSLGWAFLIFKISNTYCCYNNKFYIPHQPLEIHRGGLPPFQIRAFLDLRQKERFVPVARRHPGFLRQVARPKPRQGEALILRR